MRLFIVFRIFLGVVISNFAIWTILESYPGQSPLSGIVNASVVPIYTPATGYLILDDISLATAVKPGDALGAMIPVTHRTQGSATLPTESFSQSSASNLPSPTLETNPEFAQAAYVEDKKEHRMTEASEEAIGNGIDKQIISPLEGRVWRINSGSVEFHEAGKKIFEIVDCSDLFVYAAGAAGSLATVRRGDRAWFRADGERKSWPGTVLWSGTARAVDTMRPSAFSPEVPDDARYRFLIKLDARSDLVEKCPVGLPGRATFENYSDRLASVVKRWLSL